MNRPIYRILSGRFGAGLEIRVLMRRTAGIFGVDAPGTAGMSVPEMLRCYAALTAGAATRAIKSGQDQKALRAELYRMACRLGSSARRWLGPRDERECLAVITMLYRNIGISIRGEGSGKFCVSRCYFSSFYTPEVCCIISAIDQGIFAGIYHGGRLSFSERITEGHDVCRAKMTGSGHIYH